jgi:calcineurin-like phosphoesterase family protein
MPAVFLVSDTHFGHAGVCRFLRKDGTKLRPWENPEEMDEHMVKAWNETVRPNDKVYHLGDVVINRKALKTLGRLNGDKVLIRGASCFY